MEQSAGIAIIYQNKILLVHPSRVDVLNCWSIPKGHIEDGETEVQAAVRETYEESGLKIDPILIDNSDKIVIDYKNKKGKTYKKLHVFRLYINELSEIGLSTEILPIDLFPTLEETNMGCFFDIDLCDRYIFWRLKPILEWVKNKTIIMQVSEPDRERFMQEITNPSQPSEAFIKATKQYITHEVKDL